MGDLEFSRILLLYPLFLLLYILSHPHPFLFLKIKINVVHALLSLKLDFCWFFEGKEGGRRFKGGLDAGWMVLWVLGAGEGGKRRGRGILFLCEDGI